MYLMNYNEFINVINICIFSKCYLILLSNLLFVKYIEIIQLEIQITQLEIHLILNRDCFN